MARGGRVKTTFSYKKLSAKVATTITSGINQLGLQVNKSIGKNLADGKDLTGKKSHTLLSPDSTLPIRAREGQGSKPLVITGKLERRKIKKATLAKPVFEIEMTGKGRKGYIYGALHNQKGGYKTADGSAIPRKKVPQRNWFGVPDSCKPGGTEWKKMIARVHLLNKIAWKK